MNCFIKAVYKAIVSVEKLKASDGGPVEGFSEARIYHSLGFAASDQLSHNAECPVFGLSRLLDRACMTQMTHSRYRATGFAGRKLRNIAPVLVESYRLDVGCSDHLAPLFGFIDDEFAEIGGRTRKDRAASFQQGAPSAWDRRDKQTRAV